MRKAKFVCLSIVCCFFVAVMFCFGTMFCYASTSAPKSELDRPDSLEEGMSRKTFQELLGRRVTIRQPIMEVLERGLERKTPDVLSDRFYLPNFETRENTKAYIDFEHYPKNGQNATMLNAEGKSVPISVFERYMMIRQSLYLNKYAQADAEAGTLKKHPAIDDQYGEIEVKNNAVKKRIVTDPMYQSPMTTGLYLAPGEVATVVVKGLKDGQTLRMTTHQQETMAYVAEDIGADAYFKKYDQMILDEAENPDPDFYNLPIVGINKHKDIFNELPAMGATFSFSENNKEYKIGSPYGGPLYIQPLPNSVEVIITGAVETPHFILGVTTKEEFEATLRDAPGLICTLDTENGQLIGPSSAMRNTDDIEKVAYFWHSVFTVNESFTGKSYNFNIIMSFDHHVPAGSAVALSESSCAMPKDWLNTCLNYNSITTNGCWGVFHELGHTKDDAYGIDAWGMLNPRNAEGEVTNNLMIILVYTMLCNMDNRVAWVEHGDMSTHPYLTMNYVINTVMKYDFDDYAQFAPDKNYDDYFKMLSLYVTLVHHFGPEKFVDFFYTYKEKRSLYCPGFPRAEFAYRMALATNWNIVPWLNEVYHANITDEMFSENQLAFMNSLKVFYPIAYRYANGVNDTETARKHEIDFFNPTTFDFSGDNILSPTDFEVVRFIAPKYGKINANLNTLQVVYTPPEEIVEGDEFAAVVKITKTGEEVKLPVRFNFVFNGTQNIVWDNINTTNMDQAIAYSQENDPTRTFVSAVAGRPTFNEPGVKSFTNSTFKFIADQSGDYEFFVRSDDGVRLTFTKDDEEVGKLSTSAFTNNFQETNKLSITLEKGDTLFVEGNLVNNGGQGFLYVGVRFPNTTNIVNIPKQNIFHPSLTTEDIEKVLSFDGWTPRFLVSVKDDAKFIDPVDKTDWEILEAPNEQSQEANPQNMVDGNDSTIFHSRYSFDPITPMPHNIVLDTKAVQKFNYFEIVTRNHYNSYIVEMELYASTDNENYTKIYETDSLYYKNNRAFIEFDEISARYFKIVVKHTSDNYGGYRFTVIAELYAGVVNRLEQTVKPSTFAKEVEGFAENAAGELTSNAKDSVFEFEFVGTGFDLFANTAPEYGSAKVFIDGKTYCTLSLDDEFGINKRVLAVSDLASRRHVVTIRTTSANTFHIGYINVAYGVEVDNFVVTKPLFSKPVSALICMGSSLAIIMLGAAILYILSRKKII